jgi:hypothetical protein
MHARKIFVPCDCRWAALSEKKGLALSHETPGHLELKQKNNPKAYSLASGSPQHRVATALACAGDEGISLSTKKETDEQERKRLRLSHNYTQLGL